jgi:UDP-N-acetylmuramoylalanine--D-glutamate ligase
LLASHARVIAWDGNPEKVRQAQVDFAQASFKDVHEADWPQIDFIVMSPGVPFDHEAYAFAQKHNIPVISDFDILFLAYPEATYIGITGTNGKSTTTALIGHILKYAGKQMQVGGNIGIPVLELEPMGEGGIYVLEASSFQLYLLAFMKFNIAVMLNLTPDHLDRHGDMQSYIHAKARIFRNQGSEDKAIISVDYPEIKSFPEHIKGELTTISLHNSADIVVKNRVLYDNINSLKFDFNGMQTLPGRHNEENIAAAYSACVKAGVSPDTIVAAIRTFQGLRHRMELVASHNGLVFINDSKATNADAAEKALLCYEDIIWVLGGVPKSGGITSLGRHFTRVKKAFLFGQASAEFAITLRAANCEYVECDTLASVLDVIKSSGLKGVVLFSPACASFDQFKSFEHRGDEFCRLVKELFSGS